MSQLSSWIEEGRAVLGIEYGTTRIKAVLIGPDHAPIASGACVWENVLEGGYWTYHEADIWRGLQAAYAELKQDVLRQYGVRLTRLGALGFSAMMHGYLPFDREGRLLVPFRTWRNATTGPAADALTRLFDFHIAQRWTIAHLYQAILNGEEHVARIDHLTTLEGYVHWKLSGRRAVGVGEGSGIVPTDLSTNDYDQRMVDAFERLIAPYGYPWRLRDILPKVLPAGADAGSLTPEGTLLLDPTGELLPGTPMCPPEGDAETGLMATNCVAPGQGCVSAGTSIFSMVVLEKLLSRPYPEVDIVMTPTGLPVAMVHCSNCTSDINAWAGMLREAAQSLGFEPDMGQIYTAMFRAAMRGAPDCGGIVTCGYLSGENIARLKEGRPMLVRSPENRIAFADLSRSLILSAMATLKLGMGVLDEEHVTIERLIGHGGFFKTPGTAQSLLASALQTPVSVMETAGEGGAWGMALLAAYRVWHAPGETLERYLAERVFRGAKLVEERPVPEDVASITAYTERFRAMLELERDAVRLL